MFRCESVAFAFQEHNDYRIINLTYTPRIWVGEIWVLDFIEASSARVEPERARHVLLPYFLVYLNGFHLHMQQPTVGESGFSCYSVDTYEMLTIVIAAEIS